MKQLTIGQLIDRLESCELNRPVGFAFGYFHPTTGHSYRGSFDEFAVGYESGYPGPTVANVLAMLRQAIGGQAFHGWKGGEYQMDDDTPVWVANQGEACGIGIVNVTEEASMVVLHTAYISD